MHRFGLKIIKQCSEADGGRSARVGHQARYSRDARFYGNLFIVVIAAEVQSFYGGAARAAFIAENS